MVTYRGVRDTPAIVVTNLQHLAVYTSSASQRSLHNAPIFRLLLKVAVNGTRQCDFLASLAPPQVKAYSGIGCLEVRLVGLILTQ